ncbi:TPA: type IV conjugative transfer system pilin TraA [Yersinia enterocolitica]
MSEISIMNVPDIKPAKKGLMSRIVAAANNKTAKALVKYLAAPLAVWMVVQGFARAADLAAAGRTDVEDTFGSDSTMMYYFMVAEVVLVFLLYLKTHNPATFLLIPVFIVVTKVIFSMIGGTGV